MKRCLICDHARYLLRLMKGERMWVSSEEGWFHSDQPDQPGLFLSRFGEADQLAIQQEAGVRLDSGRKVRRGSRNRPDQEAEKLIAGLTKEEFAHLRARLGVEWDKSGA